MTTGTTTSVRRAPMKLKLRNSKNSTSKQSRKRKGDLVSENPTGSPVRFLTLLEAAEQTNLSVALLRRAATDPEFPIRLNSIRFTPKGKLRFTEAQILEFAIACRNFDKWN